MAVRKRKPINKLVLRGVPSVVRGRNERGKIYSLVDYLVAEGIILRVCPSLGALERVREIIGDGRYKSYEYTPSMRYLAARRLLEMKQRKLNRVIDMRRGEPLVKKVH